MGGNVIVGADMSSSVHVDKNGKDILILGEGQKQGLNYTFTAEAKYPINFRQWGKRFVFSLHYNGSNSFLFVSATKVCQFKGKVSEIKNYSLCFGNVSKYFTISNVKKTWLKVVLKLCSVDFNPIDDNDILDIHKYLIKRAWYKIIFGLIKKVFIGLLSSLVTCHDHTKCISWSNQKCKI